MNTSIELVAGEVLYQAREQAGLSQVGLASRAEVEQSMVSAYECHRRQPGLATLARLLSAAGYRLELRLVPGEGVVLVEQTLQLDLPVPEPVVGLTTNRGVRIDDLSTNDLRSLSLGRAVAARLLEKPAPVLAKAGSNLRHLRETHADGSADRWLDAWQLVLDSEDAALICVYLTAANRVAIDMRHTNPFAGVLTDRQRTAALELARRWRKAIHGL